MAEAAEALEVLGHAADEGATVEVAAEPQAATAVGEQRPRALVRLGGHLRHPVTHVGAGLGIEHRQPVDLVDPRVPDRRAELDGVTVDPGVGVAAGHHVVTVALQDLGVAALVHGHVALQQPEVARPIELRVVLAAPQPHPGSERVHGLLVSTVGLVGRVDVVGERGDESPIGLSDARRADLGRAVHVGEVTGDVHTPGRIGVDVVHRAVDVGSERGVSEAVGEPDAAHARHGTNGAVGGDRREVAADVQPGALDVECSGVRTVGCARDAERRLPRGVHPACGCVQRDDSGGVGHSVDVRELAGDEQPVAHHGEVPHGAVEGGPEAAPPGARGGVERSQVRLWSEWSPASLLDVGELAADEDRVRRRVLGKGEHRGVDRRLAVTHLEDAHHARWQRARLRLQLGCQRDRRQSGVDDLLPGKGSVGEFRPDPHLSEGQRLRPIVSSCPQERRGVVVASDRASIGEPLSVQVARHRPGRPCVEPLRSAIPVAGLTGHLHRGVLRVPSGESILPDVETCEAVAPVEGP